MNTTFSNVGRQVIIPLAVGAGGVHRTEMGRVTAERVEVRRGRERRILTVARPDGSAYEQDARFTDFATEFMSPAEALAELALNDAIDCRLNLGDYAR